VEQGTNDRPSARRLIYADMHVGPISERASAERVRIMKERRVPSSGGPYAGTFCIPSAAILYCCSQLAYSRIRTEKLRSFFTPIALFIAHTLSPNWPELHSDALGSDIPGHPPRHTTRISHFQPRSHSSCAAVISIPSSSDSLWVWWTRKLLVPPTSRKRVHIKPAKDGMGGSYTELDAIVVVQNLPSHYPAHSNLDQQPSSLNPQGVMELISRQEDWTVACAILLR
jgi:hypothetical protein